MFKISCFLNDQRSELVVYGVYIVVECPGPGTSTCQWLYFPQINCLAECSQDNCVSECNGQMFTMIRCHVSQSHSVTLGYYDQHQPSEMISAVIRRDSVTPIWQLTSQQPLKVKVDLHIMWSHSDVQIPHQTVPIMIQSWNVWQLRLCLQQIRDICSQQKTWRFIDWTFRISRPGLDWD